MKKLIEEIERRLTSHHDLYDSPCNGILWEEVLLKSLVATGDKSASWEGGSHKIGADITKSKYGDISCKSGAKNYIKKEDTTYLSISGSRTGKYETIEEKKVFLAIKHEDVYFCLARNDKEWKRGEKKYYFCIFKSLDYTGLEWEESFKRGGKTISGWKASNERMKVKIIKKNSDQLWTELKEDYIDEEYRITIL